jgi:acyl-CoA hydrolase
MTGQPIVFQDVEKCVDAIIDKVGKEIVFGIPLGLGKPNQLTNALYRRAKQDPSIHLRIITAITLEVPTWSSELERRFLAPFVDRVFGDFPPLQYVIDLRKGKIPENVELTEFFMKPGSFIGNHQAQQNYISSNYTHAFRDILDSGVNVIAQLIGKKELDGRQMYSMSCNPEVALDLVPRMRQQERQGKKIAIIGQVNPKLPFMFGDAVVEPGQFDMVIDDPVYYTTLFGAPKMSVTTVDFMIGIHASTLIRDGGTLQIGIGSLGDALCYGLTLRQEKNEDYRALLQETGILEKFETCIERIGGIYPFEEGLYGSTEMLVDGYLQLIDSGIIKRKVYNDINLQRLLNEGQIGSDVTPQTVKALLKDKTINARLTRQNFDFLVHYGIFRQDLAFEDGVIVADGMRIPADLSDPENFQQVLGHCLGTELKHGVLIHAGFFSRSPAILRCP